jgi:hypothetical protein
MPRTERLDEEGCRQRGLRGLADSEVALIELDDSGGTRSGASYRDWNFDYSALTLGVNHCQAR